MLQSNICLSFFLKTILENVVFMLYQGALYIYIHVWLGI